MNWNSLLLVVCGMILGLAAGLMLTPVVTTGEATHIALWVELMNRICSSIGGLGTFAALIFVVRQFRLLRLQSELLQKNVVASMDSALYSRLDSFNRFKLPGTELNPRDFALRKSTTRCKCLSIPIAGTSDNFCPPAV